MTEAQRHFRKQLLAKIHTNSAYKEIKANDAWEDWLGYRFGVDSCKELSIKELNLVLDILRGKVVDNQEYKPDLTGRSIINPQKATQKQLTQIFALQESLGWSEAELLRFVLKQLKTGLIKIEHIHILEKAQATKVITGLRAVQKYRATKA